MAKEAVGELVARIVSPNLDTPEPVASAEGSLMSVAKWMLLIGWASVISMGLMRIAGLEAQVRQAQAEVAVLRQEVLQARNVSLGKARADCDQARAEVRLLQAEVTGLLNKLLLSVNEVPHPTRRTPRPPVWADPDRPGVVPGAR